MTLQGLRVLSALIGEGGAERSGAEIIKLTGVSPGTAYPILTRFEDAAWLTSRWEAQAPQELGRPRRRLYKITAEGMAAYNQHAQELPIGGRPAWI
jgi:DNA-binding PadR family transcriptional regulator